MGVKSLLSTGLILCALSTGFFVMSFIETDFGVAIFLGTCLAGISKVVAINGVSNLMNEKKSLNGSEEFTYGFYYFWEKIIVGIVLFILFSQVYDGKNQKVLNFSWIYLPFILYSLAWMISMLEKTLNSKELTLSQNKMKEEFDNEG